MGDEDQLIDSALLLLGQRASAAWDRVAYHEDTALDNRAALYSEIAAYADEFRLRLRNLYENTSDE